MAGEVFPRVGPKPGWTPGADAFERFLTALDPDRARAASAYERLRQRTTGLLHWWGAPDAEDLADETLDRVARKVEDGAAIPKGSLGAHVRGVARLVFYERRRRPRLHAHDLTLVAAPPPSETAALRCLDSCLDSLDRPERHLVLGYYGDGKSADVRRRLAADLGLSMTALRIRAHRVRAQLETCVRACTGRM